MPDVTTDDLTNDSNHGLALTRRRALVGAAWATPIIVVASAVPAYAFSGATTVVIGGMTSTRATWTNGTPYYRWNSGTSGYIIKLTDPGVIGANSVLTTTLSGITTSGGTDTGTVTVSVVMPSNLTDSNRASGQYGSISSGWSLVGSPSINTTTRFVTYTFISASVAVGVALPDLVFEVTNSSNSGGTTYTWNTGLVVDATATASGSSAPATTASATTA